MIQTLRERAMKHKFSHYIPWNIILCWGLGLWALLCITGCYPGERLNSHEKGVNGSDCIAELAKDIQQENHSDIGKLWRALIIPQVFLRVTEIIFLVLCIVLLIRCTQRYIKQELDTAKRLLHKTRKPLTNEQSTNVSSANNYNATNCEAGKDNETIDDYWYNSTGLENLAERKNLEFLFPRENEHCRAGGDFHFTQGKIISEVHEVHSYEFPSNGVDVPTFCGMKLRRAKMEMHTYTERPCTFRNGSILKPRFITNSPEFRVFLHNMREFTRRYNAH